MLSFFPDLTNQEGHAFHIGRNMYGEETREEVLPSAVRPKGQGSRMRICAAWTQAGWWEGKGRLLCSRGASVVWYPFLILCTHNYHTLSPPSASAHALCFPLTGSELLRAVALYSWLCTLHNTSLTSLNTLRVQHMVVGHSAPLPWMEAHCIEACRRRRGLPKGHSVMPSSGRWWWYMLFIIQLLVNSQIKSPLRARLTLRS